MGVIARVAILFACFYARFAAFVLSMWVKPTNHPESVLILGTGTAGVLTRGLLIRRLLTDWLKIWVLKIWYVYPKGRS